MKQEKLAPGKGKQIEIKNNNNNCLLRRFSDLTFKALVKTASSFEELIKVWPAVEYPLKGIVVAELQIQSFDQ